VVGQSLPEGHLAVEGEIGVSGQRLARQGPLERAALVVSEILGRLAKPAVRRDGKGGVQIGHGFRPSATEAKPA
jgi:hypothetical protein